MTTGYGVVKIMHQTCIYVSSVKSVDRLHLLQFDCVEMWLCESIVVLCWIR